MALNSDGQPVVKAAPVALRVGLGRLADSWVRMGSSMAKKQGVVDSWGRLAELFLAQSQEQVRGETAARFADFCPRECLWFSVVDLRLDFLSKNFLFWRFGFGISASLLVCGQDELLAESADADATQPAEGDASDGGTGEGAAEGRGKDEEDEEAGVTGSAPEVTPVD